MQTCKASSQAELELELELEPSAAPFLESQAPLGDFGFVSAGRKPLQGDQRGQHVDLARRFVHVVVCVC